MKNKFFCCLLFSIFTVAIFSNLFAHFENETFKKDFENELFKRIPFHDRRYGTMLHALTLLTLKNAHTIVETGTARNGVKNCNGDGCSTIIWGQWAAEHNAIFYSVDIDAVAIKEARDACECYADHICFICYDSVSFLKNFSGNIDFLYLDSYDYDSNNPQASQEHHLKEIMAAYPHLNKNSIVMIDDCDLPGGGKGKLAIEYLLDRGWKIIAEKYQVILIQE